MRSLSLIAIPLSTVAPPRATVVVSAVQSTLVHPTRPYKQGRKLKCQSEIHPSATFAVRQGVAATFFLVTRYRYNELSTGRTPSTTGAKVSQLPFSAAPPTDEDSSGNLVSDWRLIAGEMIEHDAPAGDGLQDGVKPLPVALLPVVEPMRLLVQVAEQVEGLDADVRSANGAF